MMDYRMSEKFGLDWIFSNNVRVQSFYQIMLCQTKREKKDKEKANSKHNRTGMMRRGP
jgi:hypothetical protein